MTVSTAGWSAVRMGHITVSAAGWKIVRVSVIMISRASWKGVRMVRHNGRHGRLEGSEE